MMGFSGSGCILPLNFFPPMTPENTGIPDRASREREEDPVWIVENLDVFWLFASRAFEETGRGAIVVDARVQPIPGAGHPNALEMLL